MTKKKAKKIEIISQKFIDKFWSKVDRKSNDECWEWLGSDNGHEYGRFYAGGGKDNPLTYYAHRYSYTLYYGEIPEGLEIDHLCKNRKCVNPLHLEAVTTKVNVLRSDSLSAKRARQEFCIRGHPLFGDNLYEAGGKRMCKQCREDNRLNNKDRDGENRRSRYLINHGGVQGNNKGENNGQSILTEKNVKLILMYSNNGITGKKLSEMFDVSEATISRVINKKIWKDVTI